MLPKIIKQPNHDSLDKPNGSLAIGDYGDLQLQLGVDLHKVGELAKAKLIYEELLKLNPRRYEVLHLLGTLEAQIGNFERSIDLLTNAIEYNPSQWDSYSNLGNALIETNQFEKAIESYNKAIKLNPDNANDYCQRGYALYRILRLEEALSSIEQALIIRPNYVWALINCGNIQIKLGQIEESIATFKKSIACDPNNPVCHFNCGVSLFAALDYLEALSCFDQAIFLKNDYAEAHLARGDVLVASDKKRDAILSYKKSIEINNKRPEAHFNLGVTLADCKEFEGAILSLETALSLDPSMAEAYATIGIVNGNLGRLENAYAKLSEAINIKPEECSFYLNRGNILAELRRYDESFMDYDKAIELKSDYYFAFSNKGHVLLSYLNKPEAALVYFDIAIALEPNSTSILINRAEAFNRLGKLENALECFLRALEIDAEAPFIIGKCLHYKMKLCDWDNFYEGISIYESMLANGVPASVPFESLNLTDNPELHLRAAQLNSLEKHRANDVLGAFAPRPSNKILKIGYYSADLYYHPVSIWLAEQLENHDKSNVELYAFCLKSVQDPMRSRLEAGFDHWIDVQGMSDLEVAKLSRELEIDIAIDLNGQTADGRTGIFAARAAPIQVSHLGFPGSMGAEYIDYMFGQIPSPDEDLEEIATNRQFISEKIAYVPSGFTYDRQRQLSDETLTRTQFGLPKTGFVFTCQNGCQKLTPEVFDIWMEILKAVPGSVLWLLKPNDTALKNLIKEANARGIEGERLIFTAREVLPIDQEKARIGRYLSSYMLADLFLDTWPYNAGTTAIDALWAGLPVLTKMGKAYVARMATEALRAIDLPELITRTPMEYKELAIKLAHNPDRIKQLKDKVQSNRLTTALFDPVVNTRHIENAYLEMYRRYQAGLKPEDIFVHS
jgi:predicted O-linked N-acetylglucosamine transferase (SPINDLY family)